MNQEENAAQQVAGADHDVESPFEAVLAFAALQAKFGLTAPAARRLNSGRWAARYGHGSCLERATFQPHLGLLSDEIALCHHS